MIYSLQKRLRTYQLWVEFQELNREGWLRAWRRSRIQQLILKTSPIRTAHAGSIEVRILTWRRDWLNAIWALKSFYHFAQVDYPLFIHDGGLKPVQIQRLQHHFPDATIITASDADKRVLAELESRKLDNCFAYRQNQVFARKLFDFFILSKADNVISIDSDIIFFRKPNELLILQNNIQNNVFNEDTESAYSLSNSELEAEFGIRPVSNVNAGLSLISCKSMDFQKINKWLENPKLLEKPWLTEQTLHALSSTVYGLKLLPETYCVSTRPGLKPDLICKHYPGFFKTLLYEEGMVNLRDNKFIESLQVAK